MIKKGFEMVFETAMEAIYHQQGSSRLRILFEAKLIELKKCEPEPEVIDQPCFDNPFPEIPEDAVFGTEEIVEQIQIAFPKSYLVGIKTPSGVE